jgi:hypothetical protein
VRTWIIEIYCDGQWMPSLDCIPNDTRREGLEALRWVKAGYSEGKYRLSKYVRAEK